MAEARQVKNRIVQAVLRECQKLKEKDDLTDELEHVRDCLLYTSPSPRDRG